MVESMREKPAPPSIVVGVDGSKAAIHAALWAVDEALSRDIPLRLLHAVDPGEAAEGAEHAARKLAVDMSARYLPLPRADAATLSNAVRAAI